MHLCGCASAFMHTHGTCYLRTCGLCPHTTWLGITGVIRERQSTSHKSLVLYAAEKDGWSREKKQEWKERAKTHMDMDSARGWKRLGCGGNHPRQLRELHVVSDIHKGGSWWKTAVRMNGKWKDVYVYSRMCVGMGVCVCGVCVCSFKAIHIPVLFYVHMVVHLR